MLVAVSLLFMLLPVVAFAQVKRLIFNDTSATEIYTKLTSPSLPDARPISS